MHAECLPHQVFKDGLAKRTNGPYLTHLLPGCAAATVRFCPYEDVLGIGHSRGFSSMLAPGAGEPNFDSFEANPYENRKQRREGEVHSLLDKLPPATIQLDPTRLNTVDRQQTERQREFQAAREERLAEIQSQKKSKKKTRGRSKISRKLAKKQSNIMDEKRLKRQEELEERQKRIKQRAGPANEEEASHDPLSRFGS